MDHAQYATDLARRARLGGTRLNLLSGLQKTAALMQIAAAIRAKRSSLIEANTKDLNAAQTADFAPALVERLKLNEKRIESMARGVEQIAQQPDHLGQTLEGYVRPNGLRIEKRAVPIGVVLFFYESRPNVTSDAAALCIKSGNAVILRGGKEAIHSNRAIAAIIRDALLPLGQEISDAVQFVDNSDRALVPVLLKQDKYIDLVIPRGGESLIRAVVSESTIPVLKHFTGNCHIYVDAGSDAIADQVRKICVNAKTSYPGGAVCNAVEHLLIHESVAQQLIPALCADLAAKGVEIRGDERTRQLVPSIKPATDDDWATEYLAFIIGMKVVDSLDVAIDHINEYGSHHTDGIVSTSMASIDRFVQGVDSASVMVNASTRLADGGEYGLGAEIGISTDKLHARGPMGAADLLTYKWIVTGNGHIRE